MCYKLQTIKRKRIKMLSESSVYFNTRNETHQKHEMKM